MNILVPYSWIKEFLKTEATPGEISRYLSLCSQSVEKTTKVGNDYIYEIEITTNRPDCLSVLGIARELAAILPRFGIKATLKKLDFPPIPKPVKDLPLQVEITKNTLCPRFTALIFDNIVIRPSPKIIQERLQKSGIRALNNVVDISNYLMLELGQPMHTFDYDKILGAKMILREAREGEEIITLDSQKRILPEGAIVIEDGKGRLVDLCGIMGGENSQVDEKTKRVLLFVQTYDPGKIRQTCQKLGFRTEAASRFEKGVDPEGVILALKKATQMFEENCQAVVASKLIDIYPHPPKPKTVTLSGEKLDLIMGVHLDLKEAQKILISLGFKTTIEKKGQSLKAEVPHWRYEDINIPEDLVEEIARIYGYHLLPTSFPEGKIPIKMTNLLLETEEKIKDILKFWGFTEIATYSLISEDLLSKLKIGTEKTLKIVNPLNNELVYLRPSLIPSILQAIKKNKQREEIKIFELANVYLPRGKNQLPKEISTLTVAVKGEKFFFLKGIVESLFEEIGINNFEFAHPNLSPQFYAKIFSPLKVGEILVGTNYLGILGEVDPLILKDLEIDEKIILLEINLLEIIKFINPLKKYRPLPKYPPTVEDLTFIVPPKTEIGKIIQLIKKIHPYIEKVEFLDSFKDSRTFRLTYRCQNKTLNAVEVEKIREKIIKTVGEKLGAVLKAKEQE